VIDTVQPYIITVLVQVLASETLVTGIVPGTVLQSATLGFTVQVLSSTPVLSKYIYRYRMLQRMLPIFVEV
jgi:hypothetical protein